MSIRVNFGAHEAAKIVSGSIGGSDSAEMLRLCLNIEIPIADLVDVILKANKPASAKQRPVEASHPAPAVAPPVPAPSDPPSLPPKQEPDASQGPTSRPQPPSVAEPPPGLSAPKQTPVAKAVPKAKSSAKAAVPPPTAPAPRAEATGVGDRWNARPIKSLQPNTVDCTEKSKWRAGQGRQRPKLVELISNFTPMLKELKLLEPNPDMAPYSIDRLSWKDAEPCSEAGLDLDAPGCPELTTEPALPSAVPAEPAAGSYAQTLESVGPPPAAPPPAPPSDDDEPEFPALGSSRARPKGRMGPAPSATSQASKKDASRRP